MPERIQKILARAGLASRRKAEALVSEGRVTVDGRTARIGELVDAGSAIAVDGKPIETEPKRYLALNKPAGYITARSSPRGEPTVMDLLSVAEQVYPVGRLDRDTAGLLFLTNDGEWANHVIHPRYGVVKEYRALLRGRLDEAGLRRLRAGTSVEGRWTFPRTVSPERVEGGNTWVSFELEEGRKRELRIIAAAAGHPVVYLERVRIGGVRLGHLPPGRFRDLSKREVGSFVPRARTAGLGESGPRGEAAGGHRRAGRSGEVDSRSGTRAGTRLRRPRHRSDVPGVDAGGSGGRHRTD